MTSFVHLIAGENAATVVREALRALGRDEEVVSFPDDFAAGPLLGIDAGGKERITWWARLGETHSPEDAAVLDDVAVWERLRTEARDVVLWYGTSPNETLLMLRACWQFREHADRLSEVALKPQLKPGVPAFVGAIAIQGPKAAQAAWPERAKITDVAQRAERWEKLRSHDGDFLRELREGEIVELPVDAHDAKLLTAAADWVLSLRLLGAVLAHVPVGDSLLRWRVYELLRKGQLQGRGDLNRLGLPNELKAK